MKKDDLLKQMLELEEINEDLLQEIYETDQIMRRIGFSDGLATVKAVAISMCKKKKKRRTPLIHSNSTLKSSMVKGSIELSSSIK